MLNENVRERERERQIENMLDCVDLPDASLNKLSPPMIVWYTAGALCCSMKLITLTGSVDPSTAPKVKPCESVQPIWPPPTLSARGTTTCCTNKPVNNVLHITTANAKIKMMRRSRFKKNH